MTALARTGQDGVKIAVLFAVCAAACLVFILPGLDAENYAFFLGQRVPKVAAIVITGCAIAFSSVLFQTVTNNRILTPATLGFDALYLLIQTSIIFVFSAGNILARDKNVNFVFSAGLMVAMAMVLFRVMMRRSNTNLIYLILVGTIFGQLFRTLSYFLLMVISPSEFVSLQNRMFASFGNINTGIVIIAAVVCAAVVPFVFRDLPKFDVVALGREPAISLGIDHEKLVRKTFVIAAVLISVATALVGPIAFLGLLVANLARQMAASYRHSVVVLMAMLISSILLLTGQFIVERFLNFDTTVTVIINFVGGLYFIWLLLKESRL